MDGYLAVGSLEIDDCDASSITTEPGIRTLPGVSSEIRTNVYRGSAVDAFESVVKFFSFTRIKHVPVCVFRWIILDVPGASGVISVSIELGDPFCVNVSFYESDQHFDIERCVSLLVA